MGKLKRTGLMLILLTLAFASIGHTKAQVSTSMENMETFLDSNIPGIHIQVNATAETQPGQNITVMLSLKRQTAVSSVYVEYFNLSIFGFVNGTYKILMASITDNNFPLDNSASRYNRTFSVPQQVWDVTYGEITLTYNANETVGSGPGFLVTPYQNIASGFTMTLVENVYLKSIEDQLTNLEARYNQLHENYTALQGNLTELQARYNQLHQNYTALQGNLGGLNNTRSAVAVLAIISVFFLATTLYLIMRKPKERY
jgi:hypothetical protein